MTNQEILESYLDFSRFINVNDKLDELGKLKSLPDGNYYIFRRWTGGKEDILFKSRFTLEIPANYEGFNNRMEDFIILKNN